MATGGNGCICLGVPSAHVVLGGLGSIFNTMPNSIFNWVIGSLKPICCKIVIFVLIWSPVTWEPLLLNFCIRSAHDFL